MKQYIFSSIVLFSLTISYLNGHNCPAVSTTDTFDEQLYCSLVYLPKEVRENILLVTELFQEQSWSTTYKDMCIAIQHEATVMPYKDVMCMINECLEACNNFPQYNLDTIQIELQKYKKILDSGTAHICSWKNDDDANKIVTRNFDGFREILQLYTRNLTVDGIETVNGLLTVNGILAINGRLILNGVDINTIIANAAAAAGSGGTSSGITTINGDTGSVTGSVVTIAANGASGAGSSISFTGAGTNMSFNTTDVHNNIFLGTNSGNLTVTGSQNVGYGKFTLRNITTGSNNVAVGHLAGGEITTGSSNVFVGDQAGGVTITGGSNICIGNSSGIALTTGSGTNIMIGNAENGTPADANTIRIGTSYAKCFIGGIRGVTTANTDTLPVLIDSASQLGTVSSSKRFKENITPMPDSFSENVLNLNPTLFNYAQDTAKKQTWGLIAEDVQQIFPALVVSDEEGLPFTVKYHELPVLLLNELIKLKKEYIEIKQENIAFKNELENL